MAQIGRALGCEALFYKEHALQMQELIERATGEPCPCKQGKLCPLLPVAMQREATAPAA